MSKVSSYYTNTCTGTFTTLISCASSTTRNWWPKAPSVLWHYTCFAISNQILLGSYLEY